MKKNNELSPDVQYKKMRIELKKLKLNDGNPRHIKDAKFRSLKRSIEDFPEMLNIRPIVVNTNLEVLGGNMRLRAMLDLGIEHADVIITNLPKEKQDEFIIKDNVTFGEFDWSILANTWDAEYLSDWGLDIPGLNSFSVEIPKPADDDKEKKYEIKCTCPKCGFQW